MDIAKDTINHLSLCPEVRTVPYHVLKSFHLSHSLWGQDMHVNKELNQKIGGTENQVEARMARQQHVRISNLAMSPNHDEFASIQEVKWAS